MSSSITLSAGVRQNLLALQSTAQLMSVTQNRLATGKRVNSALDNPSNYFTSQALNNRAGDLNALLDSIGQSQQILTTASQAIDAITKLVQSAKSIAQQARQAAAPVGASYSLTVTGTVATLTGATALNTLGFANGDTVTISDSNGNTATFTVADATTDTVSDLMAGITSSGNWSVALNGGAIEITSSSSATLTIAGAAGGLAGVGLTAGNYTPTFSVTTPNATRTSLQSDFNVTLNQIDDLAKDASYNGINLLNGDDLKVVFNEAGTSALTINGVTFDLTGLGLTNAAGNDFQDNAKIDAFLSNLDTALNTLRTQGSKFGSNLTLVQTRQEFTKAMINTLQTGADNLVLADTNEEGANMLALQTRQQLSTTALALSAQADQAVLRLF
ncbi:MAG TPA: flagellin [Xanthobacteraceae bacterium]|nr:flagellin [Xanthobacteraceae bacterium]